jgi:hypothetical protein
MISCVIEVVTLAWAEGPVLTVVAFVAAAIAVAGAVAFGVSLVRRPLGAWWHLAPLALLAIGVPHARPVRPGRRGGQHDGRPHRMARRRREDVIEPVSS